MSQAPKPMGLNIYYACAGFALLLGQIAAVIIALNSWNKAKKLDVKLVAQEIHHEHQLADTRHQVDLIGERTDILTKIFVDKSL